MASADEDTWAEVERAYVETDETITSICQRLGVPASTLQRRAVVKGWPRRKGRAGQPAQANGVVTVGSVEAARNDVARRLYRRMSQKLTKMEQDAGLPGPDPAATDPDDRMLTALIRQFEKLTGLDGLTERERGTASGKRQSSARDKSRAPEQQHSPPLDAERIRNEIAERLEKLHLDRQRKSGSE